MLKCPYACNHCGIMYTVIKSNIIYILIDNVLPSLGSGQSVREHSHIGLLNTCLTSICFLMSNCFYKPVVCLCS